MWTRENINFPSFYFLFRRSESYFLTTTICNSIAKPGLLSLGFHLKIDMEFKLTYLWKEQVQIIKWSTFGINIDGKETKDDQVLFENRIYQIRGLFVCENLKEIPRMSGVSVVSERGKACVEL